MEQFTREELNRIQSMFSTYRLFPIDLTIMLKAERMFNTPEGKEDKTAEQVFGPLEDAERTITEAEWNEDCSKGWMDRTFGREKSGQPGEECTSAPSGREKNSDSDEPDGFREEHGFWRGGDYYIQRTSSTSGEPSDEQEKQE